MKPTKIHTTCLAVLLLAAGCESDDASGGTTGTSTTASATSGPGGSNASGDSGVESGQVSGAGSDGGFGDTGSAGSSGFGSSGFGSSGFGSSGFDSSGFGSTDGGAVDCEELASMIPVARELSVNAAFGGSVPGLEVDSDVLVVDFGDAASPSCLGVGAPACVPAHEFAPWDMFELRLAPAAQGLGNYLIGPGELIAGQLVENYAQEPECSPSLVGRENFSASLTVYGVSTSDGKGLTGLDAYFCDYSDEVWRLEINVCG